ncbi:hypothetical protein ACFPM0_05150 [Pseudonocardia sulfidoxydans]|uniref:hypothetical protein n=1 Tax=Pseudonocardia sulfidoxydans TaxID=54011 RepID=UPI00361E9FD5
MTLVRSAGTGPPHRSRGNVHDSWGAAVREEGARPGGGASSRRTAQSRRPAES